MGRSTTNQCGKLSGKPMAPGLQRVTDESRRCLSRCLGGKHVTMFSDVLENAQVFMMHLEKYMCVRVYIYNIHYMIIYIIYIIWLYNIYIYIYYTDIYIYMYGYILCFWNVETYMTCMMLYTYTTYIIYLFCRHTYHIYIYIYISLYILFY